VYTPLCTSPYLVHAGSSLGKNCGQIFQYLFRLRFDVRSRKDRSLWALAGDADRTRAVDDPVLHLRAVIYKQRPAGLLKRVVTALPASEHGKQRRTEGAAASVRQLCIAAQNADPPVLTTNGSWLLRKQGARDTTKALPDSAKDTASMAVTPMAAPRTYIARAERTKARAPRGRSYTQAHSSRGSLRSGADTSGQPPHARSEPILIYW
jgi:hypothetical protein